LGSTFLYSWSYSCTEISITNIYRSTPQSPSTYDQASEPIYFTTIRVIGRHFLFKRTQTFIDHSIVYSRLQLHHLDDFTRTSTRHDDLCFLSCTRSIS
jgi:hypothetical protein